MTVYAIQHAFQGVSGLPSDRFVNTFHTIGPVDPLTPDFAAAATAIKLFYNPTGGVKISSYMSNAVRGIGRTIKIYDLSDPKPRAPVYEFIDAVVPWAQSASQPLPSECCVCLSYDAPKLSGLPQARRRGRLFIGPLSIAALNGNTDPPQRPNSSLQDALNTAAGNLQDALAAANMPWVVYSPTSDDGTGAVGSAALVTRSWTDDAFDTQRRRGERPSAKRIGAWT